MGSDVDPRGRAAGSLSTLEEHAAVYTAVVDSALDAVIVVDDSGIVVTINPAAETTFGYSRAEAIGRSIGELIVPEHLRDAHEQGMARYRATGRPSVLGKRVEMDARCKDGRIIPVELAITEVVLPQARLFTANLRDLSGAREAAREIDRQRDALHQSEKLAALGSLLAGVAHELNNPLSVVLGHAVLMGQEAARPDGNVALRERARKIESAAERCTRVVRSFLAIARQRKTEKRAVQVAPLIDAAVELLQYNLRSSGVTVTRAYDGGLPDVFVDQDQVHQIVVNLIVNATQALETVEGHREIRISAGVGDDDRLRILFADNGPGVPLKIAGRIFDPFFTTKQQDAGTGIGLAVSRGLAQSQGGSLTLDHSPLGGAAFKLCLPLAPAGRGTDGDRTGPGADGAPPAVSGFPSRRALVVDDEPEVAVLVAEALGAVGYACDVAASGREAQALIAAGAGDYDAVICDIRMPDIDGPTLFAWIEAHHPGLVGRIVLLTGDALGPNAARFLAACGRPVVEKPFKPSDIVRLVADLPPARELQGGD